MTRANEAAETIDKIVGNKIERLRIEKGLSRAELALFLNITGQQLQKYERGTNRVSAGRLFAIAKTLDKTVGFFFGELDEYEEIPCKNKKLYVELKRDFNSLESSKDKEKVCRFAKSLVQSQ